MLALIAVILVAILLLPSGGDKTAPVPAADREQAEADSTTLVRAGDTAPDFTVEMFDGERITLSDLRGKVVLVNFWATWCPPCRQELARVEKDLIERFSGRDFVLLPISRGEQRETVAAFREKMNYTFPMGLDPEKAVYDLYASNYIPRNFLVGRNGKIVLTTTGYTPEEFDALVRTIEETLEQ